MGATGDKMKGKANEAIGKMTDDKSKEMKGKAQQAKGDAKDEFEDTRRGTDEDRRR